MGCGTVGCTSTATRLREHAGVMASFDPATRDKIERGIVEPGFTPLMVYLALGKPTSPARADIVGTREGTWTYRSFHGNDRDYVRAGFRRRVVFDPVRKSDSIVTEPADPRLYPHLQDHTLRITFRDGHLVEVQRLGL